MVLNGELDKKLLEVVKRGNAYKVIEFLREGANVNTRDEDGLTPLHYAASRGYVEVARLLLENGADVNAKNEHGITPLHVAASEGHAEVVRLLLEHGADANARDEDGLTPLHNAAANGHLDVVKLLLEKGADPAIRSNGDWTPLDIARALGHAEVVKVLETFLGSTPSIVSVECSSLHVGEWGRLLVRVRGSGTAALSLEGDVDWINPEVVELSGETVVEVPVKPRVGGEVPVKVSVESSGSKTSKIVWLKIADKVRKCPNCGAPVELGAKYCWKCGTKLS
jgi:hypothetical protein